MKIIRPASVLVIALSVVLTGTASARATGVPIQGFSPLVGLSLTNRFEDDNDPTFTFFQADLEPTLVGTQFGAGGVPYYDIALVDSGAAISLITKSADSSFNLQGAGFRGPLSNTIGIGGATGALEAIVDDPMAMFVSGLGNRNTAAPTFGYSSTSTFVGQSSISLATLPVESDLPSVVGIPFMSQYTMYIRSDQPQIFQSGGKTVRAPQISFLPLGSGGQGIARRAPMTLKSSSSFSSAPLYIYDFNNFLDGTPLTEHPSAPTILPEPGAMFVNVNVANNGNALNGAQFFMDTGADVSVVSTLNALNLGFNLGVSVPDFTIDIIGSGGETDSVPGFFVDELTVQAVGDPVPMTLYNVPMLVLDVPDPTDPTNAVAGILGTNVLAGRNVVIDPKPLFPGGGSGPSLYISNPITTEHAWASAASSANFATSGNWNAAGTVDVKWIANVRNVSGSAQEAVVSADATVWELNVSGSGAGTMAVRVQSGKRLTTFSGVNIETGGTIKLEGGTLDAHYVEIRGGTLTGAGTVATGSGPIPGQLENRIGTIAPGNGIGKLTIQGRFSNGDDGTLVMELGGFTAGTGYDQIAVLGGPASIDGDLVVTLLNVGPSFTPGQGDVFSIITATDGVGGKFDNLTLPLGYNWRVAYEENSVDLVIGIPGDYNDNGTVDAADYTVWRNTLHSTTNWDADGNGNGIIDAGDFVVWKNHFGTTAAGSGSAVPEPASAGLVVLALVSLVAGRIRRSRSLLIKAL